MKELTIRKQSDAKIAALEEELARLGLMLVLENRAEDQSEPSPTPSPLFQKKSVQGTFPTPYLQADLYLKLQAHPFQLLEPL
jgi:hypothetical protein